MSFITRRTEEFSASVADRVHGVEDRQAGADERGQLPRQVHEVVALDPRAGDLGLQEALLLGDLDVAQFAVVERQLDRCAAVGLLDALGLLAVRGRRRRTRTSASQTPTT